MNTQFETVCRQIAESALRVGRNPESVRIVGVSKRQPNDKLVTAVLDGLREIGENRVQEASEKRPIVEKLLEEVGFDISQLKWHMVGRLQSNKAATAAGLFDVIQSVENVKIANRLSRTAAELGKSLEVFIEVNTSGEASKAGVHPDSIIDLIGEIKSLPGIKLNGLMTLGPLTEDRDRIRASFDRLKETLDGIEVEFPSLTAGWDLSMGMSGDFSEAIAAGATIVRIGTAIFGPRTTI
ncbi:YggS family pyridoxal phosphate-dependent enzyme [bacterium]|nr:YggS family pyridoxal phosphate-dependent enzyme [bacterium]